jgi:hypothetical protein
MSGRRFRGPRNRRPGRGAGGANNGPPRNPTTSPLQPHVKVTLRSISGDGHDSILGVVATVQEFLNGAFDINGSGGSGSQDAYTKACQAEKASFEKTKSLLESKSDTILGYSYEEKTPQSVHEMPSVEAVVNSVHRESLDNNKSCAQVIDLAMSSMMNECGKVYLDRVGGKVFVDKESIIVAGLAERIGEEKKKIKSAAAAASETAEKAEGENDVERETSDDKEAVKQITQDMEKISTDNKATKSDDTIRIRILSVTPVKKSKRRGDIGARVELVLYPPDPCMIFKALCREAGKVAAERYETKDTEAKDEEKTQVQDGEDVNEAASDKQPPTIPNFPRLSPAERSRAIARSRVLMDRTISAMKIHARTNSTFAGWDIFESASQKTWKGPSFDIVSSLLNGASLSTLLAKETGNGEDTKPRKNNARGDRYDSTIENSEDYKSFMEMYTNGGGAVPTPSDKSTSKPKEEKLDEEGRPLSAIVQHLQSKRQEEARAKAEAAAAASRARAKASAEAAREKARKRELEAKTRKAKARMKREEERKKNKGSGGSGSNVSSRPGSGGTALPPPGAVLLKKGGDVPTSGFSSK